MMTVTASPPALSVTVLNYNYARFLPKCLDSILAQSFRDFEIILIDDKSTDDSRGVINRYRSDPRVRVFDHEVNRGFTHSLIEGSEASRGRYITVISADDWVLDQKAFEKQVSLMDAEPKLSFVYSAYSHFIDERTYESDWRGAPESFVLFGTESFKKIVINPFLLHTGTVIRKSAYDAVGGYDASARYLVDSRMWLSLCHVGGVGYIDECLYAYRRHGNNMSRSAEALREEILEILDSIDRSFGKLPESERRELHGLRADAERRALTAFAMDDVFRGHYRAGWRNYLIGVKVRPLQTVLQKATLILALRTILGRRYNHVRELRNRLSGRQSAH